LLPTSFLLLLAAETVQKFRNKLFLHGLKVNKNESEAYYQQNNKHKNSSSSEEHAEEQNIQYKT